MMKFAEEFGSRGMCDGCVMDKGEKTPHPSPLENLIIS